MFDLCELWRRSIMSVNNHSEVNNHHGNENVPLLEVGTNGSISKPPIATIETLEDDDDRETVTKPYPGVDDGFFNPNSNHPDIEPNIPVLSNRAGEADESDGKSVGVGTGTVVPIHPDTRHHFPYAPGYGPDFEGTFTDLESIPDVNVYQHKKTLAQGMMDLALFSANANQLRYVLETYNRHPYYYPSVILITISLLLQVINYANISILFC